MKSKKALIVISFGSTFTETRLQDIGGIEQCLAEAFPAYEKFRAFTSNIIRKRLAEKGLVIADPESILKKLVANGYEEVILQPTHLLHGEEFEQKIEALKEFYAPSFRKFIVSQPLIVQDSDYELTACAIASQFPALGKNEGIILMGHGTPRNNNKAFGYTYNKMQAVFDAMELPVVVGTVEESDSPNFEAALDLVLQRGYKKVHMYPLMVVAGDHANNDMYGDDVDSWKCQIEARGVKTEGHLHGIGRNKAVQALYVEHVLEAMSKNK
ncbi:MAG: sirohydrochlorin cobaltochelatase [Phascolarctobacterium sp.]|nr:sirohydrochlorin cobaltochelatase [Phascolarctobacterium sp.]